MKTARNRGGWLMAMAGQVLFLAGTEAARADAYSAAVLADNPVAYFRLNETSGNYLSSTNSYAGTVTGTFGRGGYGPGAYTLRGAYLFNGFDVDNLCPRLNNPTDPAQPAIDYITVPTAVALNPGTNDFTMEAWIGMYENYTGANPGAAIVKSGGAAYAIRTKTVASTMSVDAFIQRVGPAAIVTPVVALSIGTIHHVVAVFDRNPPGVHDAATLYIDGVAQGATTNSNVKSDGTINGSTVDLQPTGNLGIGALPGSILGLRGRVDEVAIYSRALSAVQVANHYAAARGALRGLSLPPVTNNLLVALPASSAVTSSTGRVGIWIDEATAGGYQDFLQLTSANRPSWARETLPTGRPAGVLGFTMGKTNYLEMGANPAAMDANTWTAFAVFKPNPASAGTARFLFGSGYTSGAGFQSSNFWASYVHVNNSFLAFSRSSSSAFVGASITPPNSNQWFVMSSIWNGTAAALNGNAATTVVVRLKDQSRTVYTPASANGANAMPSGHIKTRIGEITRPPFSFPFDGKIAEILFYKTALSAAEVSAVEAYLVEKCLISRQGTVTLMR